VGGVRSQKEKERTMRRAFNVFLALTIGAYSVPGLAQESYSGFLSDYEQLEPTEDVWIDYIYTGPEFRPKVASTTAFMIEQPEIFIAPDSKYGGMKPDDMKMLADSLRAIWAEGLVEKYQIAASPGPNTLLMRMALTNVHLKKKGRGVLGYTPVGFVVGGAKKALMNEFVDNILLTEVVWEAEILDSQTGERYGALFVGLGNKAKKKEYSSWDELMQALEVGVSRVMCRLDNAKLEDDEIRDCLAEITGM
jgi:hypothetical protein